MKRPGIATDIMGKAFVLKADRALAYQIDSPVTVLDVYQKDGYKTPWILGVYSDGRTGCFRLSDFR